VVPVAVALVGPLALVAHRHRLKDSLAELLVDQLPAAVAAGRRQ
jgi:hypothetical protein